MTNQTAEMIARSFQLFLEDYGVASLLEFASEMGVMVKTVNTTLTKRADSDHYEVTIWDQGKREIKTFKDHWDALFLVREIEQAA